MQRTFSNGSGDCQSSMILAHFCIGRQALLEAALLAPFVQAAWHLDVRLPVAGQQAVVDAVALAPHRAAAALAGACRRIAVLAVQ